ncbi:MAG: polysaccharide deacetylase family protein [Clostridia bacterium]|nr:polysaccharide deacetylase family protein [Clostridia bacterium]
MNRNVMRWPGFLRKAVTLSYDDGVIYDKKLISIMDKYGLKGTFNINSGAFASSEGERRLTKEAAFELYANSPHEVAVHGVRHISLALVDSAVATGDVINDRRNLEEMFGRIVKGMAYACGSYNDQVVEILKSCGIKYARTIESTEKFEIPTDWLRMPATCHHKNPRLMELAEEFVSIKEGRNFWWSPPKLFYLWGHSYEFNDSDNWDIIERFGEYMGGREDIWYATNGEIYDYVRAFESLEFSADGRTVYNPTATDVYMCYGENILIPAGQTVRPGITF